MDKKLLEFLITAKKATYAGKGAETTSSRIKSHDLIYEDGDFLKEALLLVPEEKPFRGPADSNIFCPFLVQRRIPTGGLSPSCISFSLLVKTISI